MWAALQYPTLSVETHPSIMRLYVYYVPIVSHHTTLEPAW